MSYLENLKKISLLAILRPDDSAWLRSIFRWYSKTFHTPLHITESLPKEHILQTYFESTFEEMSEEDLKAELEYILETPEERKAKADAVEAEEIEFMQMLEEEVQKEQNKAKNLKGKLQAPKFEPLKQKEASPPESMHGAADEFGGSDFPDLPNEPINVSFNDNDLSMEELLSQDFIPPKPK